MPRRCALSSRASSTSGGFLTSIPRWWRMISIRSTCPPSTRWSWRESSSSACSTIMRTSPPARPPKGGAAAIRQPWRMAAVYLDAAYCGAIPSALAVAQRNERAWANVLIMARRGINAPVTSSAGRLFDAVAALLGVRDVIRYEGQAAIELEQLADPAEQGSYQAAVTADGPDGLLRVAGADLVRAAAEDLAAGPAPATIAARFHSGVTMLIAAACTAVRDRSGLGTVALSGGVFQNRSEEHTSELQS